MKARDFVEKKLRNLIEKFPNISIRYEHCKATDSHLIEILPLHFFNNNEQYMREEWDIEDEFENMYPLEDIVFISEKSLIEIKKADLTLGYETITFDNEGGSTEFIVEDFINGIEFHENNYALAA